jgi:hypothetical protein
MSFRMERGTAPPHILPPALPPIALPWGRGPEWCFFCSPEDEALHRLALDRLAELNTEISGMLEMSDEMMAAP